MKKAILIVPVLLLTLLAVFVLKNKQSFPAKAQKTTLAEHIYATWDTMEFDKCVAAWLIVRFVDKDAKFVFHPQGKGIKQGIVFDVPGAAWSRKHKKCTSDCILESITINDPSVRKIVEMAHHTELNFWQLERWPKATNCFYDVKKIMDETIDPLECFEKTRLYFDRLIVDLEKESINANTKFNSL